MMMTSRARQLQDLCKFYWNKGDEGRCKVIQNQVFQIPRLQDDYYRKAREPDSMDSALEMSEDEWLAKQDTVPAQVISLPGYDGLILDSVLRGIYIRKDYTTLLRRLEEMPEQKERGAIIIGTPGIGEQQSSSSELIQSSSLHHRPGKTLFLVYLLIERVLAGKKTIFQSSSKNLVLLDGGTVTEYVNEDFEANKHMDAWALLDAGEEIYLPHDPPIALNSGNANLPFIVLATSPQPAKWRRYFKYLHAEILASDLWSWNEMFIAKQVICRPPQTIFDDYVVNSSQIAGALIPLCGPILIFRTLPGTASFCQEFKIGKKKIWANSWRLKWIYSSKMLQMCLRSIYFY